MEAWVIRSGSKGDDVSHLFAEKSVVAIGWLSEDLSRLNSREEIKERIRVEYPESSDGAVNSYAGTLWRFLKDISVGDLILTPPTGSTEVWIGRCRGPYEYLPYVISDYYPDVRRVSWLKQVSRSLLSGPLQSSISSELTVFNVSKHIEEIEGLINGDTPWTTFNGNENPTPPPPPTDPWSPSNITALAQDLLWQPNHLQEIIQDLQEKRQVIFYGPPGTGKTYVAREIAKQCRLNGGDFEIVQFHPSYSYEDFVEGYRPTLTDNGQAAFKLVSGPLRRIAQKASDNPNATFILIIDELNRGNVAKVFGELYFLLEYRDEEVRLQYGGDGQGFSLPKNLWFICTMNTADRSIALMDAALRRRFYFAPFFPNEPPIAGLLRRWLVRENQDTLAADLVDAANKKLERDMGIGPSYFMQSGETLDENRVRRIWDRAVIPYIEEQFFGDADKLAEFAFDRLKRQLAGQTPANDAPNAPPDNDDAANTC